MRTGTRIMLQVKEHYNSIHSNGRPVLCGSIWLCTSVVALEVQPTGDKRSVINNYICCWLSFECPRGGGTYYSIDWAMDWLSNCCICTHLHKHGHQSAGACFPLHETKAEKSLWPQHVYSLTRARSRLSLITADPTPPSEQSGIRGETLLGWEKSGAGGCTREAGGKRKVVRDRWQWNWDGRTINLERCGKWSHSDGELESDKTLWRDGEGGRGVRLHGVMAGPHVDRQVIVQSIERVLSEQLLAPLNCGSGRGQYD